MAILAASVTVAVALVTGLGYAAYLAVAAAAASGHDRSSSLDVATGVGGGATAAQGRRHRDAIAAAPMLSVPADAALPDGGWGSDREPLPGAATWGTGSFAPDPSGDDDGPGIDVPSGSGALGPGLVLTGYPHTPQGAVAQLAQIDSTVLDSMAIQAAQTTYAGWALPGGVGASNWWITRGVRGFLAAAGMGQVKDTSAAVAATPAAALIKGSDGPDWATVCVLMTVTATYRSRGQTAMGHCERMQWVDAANDPVPGPDSPSTTGYDAPSASGQGRWMIAPGPAPALAPSTWPGTALAARAGWRTWHADAPASGDPASTGVVADLAGRTGGAGDPLLVDTTLRQRSAAEDDRHVAPAAAIEPAIAGSPAAAAVQGLLPNPLGDLGSIIAQAAADAWTAAMLTVWSSSLYAFGVVMAFTESFLTPDLAGDGPGQTVYGFALWLALSLVVALTAVQLGAAAFRREGKGLARALIGVGQFVLICATWFGYCATIVAACGALTKALLKSLLGVDSWSAWDPMAQFHADDITDATVATVLAFLGVFLWLAVIGHVLVYLTRAAGLLVLTATGPLSAAGLVSDFTRAWFWKSLRWFHAAAFTPVLMVVVLGVGVQLSTGAATGLTDTSQQAIGTALPAVMMILISVVAPLALFKLLAFVDPGTPSGASFRQGMAANGGVQGLLSGGSGSGNGSGGVGDGSAATLMGGGGRSAGEESAEVSTGDRFNQSAGRLTGGLPGIGQAVASGIGMISGLGAQGASLMADQSNQAGVGHPTYGPDFSGGRSGGAGNAAGRHPLDHGDTGADRDQSPSGGGGDGPGDGTGGAAAPWPDCPPFPAPPHPHPGGAPPLAASPSGGTGTGSGAGGAAGGSAGAGAAAGGAAIPPVA